MGSYNKTPHLGRNRAGRYEIRWTENRRSRSRSTGTDDHGRAQQALADFINRREAVEAARKDPTVAWALDTYMVEHIRPHAADVAAHEVRVRWLKTWAGSMRVAELRPGHGRKYATVRRSGKVGASPGSEGTIRRELGILQAALNYAVREHGVEKDSVPVLARPDRPSPREHWLTRDQVDAMLDWFATREREERMSRAHRFVVLGLATAARKGAIEALEWRHVDRAHGLVRYDLQVRVQTRKRRVAVPIAAWLHPYLDRMQAERETVWVLDHDGDIRGAFDYAMRCLARDTGDESYTSTTRHTLRHTAATLALQNGATIWQVAGMLGDSPSTVMDIYGHHGKENIQGAVDSWRAGNGAG